MKIKFLLHTLMASCLLCLALNVKAIGTLPLNGSVSGNLTPAGKKDTFSLTTNADGRTDLTLTATSGQYVIVYLYDHDGITQLNDASTAGTATISTDGLAAGTYYVVVYALYSSQTPTYTLANAFVVAPVANDAEPDSSRTTALTLPLNSTTTGHIGYYYNNHRDILDFYKITTNGDGLLQLKLTSNNGNYVAAYLFDNNGTTVLGNINTTTTTYLNTDGLAAGTYYVQISSLYATLFEPYTLTDSLFTVVQLNDHEPDSSRATALTLPPNSTTTGHIGYYYNNHRDILDFYKITTNGDGLLQLKLTSNNGNYVSAYLFDNNGTTVLGNTNTTTTTYLNTDGLAAGTYYVQISSLYATLFEPYTLTDSLFTVVQPNDHEPDSTPALANILPLNDSVTGHEGYYYNNNRDSVDWYKVTTNADGDLRLTLSSDNGHYVLFTLYDNDAQTVLNSDNTGGTITISTDGLAVGTYYVKINTFYGGDFAPYTIYDSLFTYNKNDVEPNAYFNQAETISANRTVTGHVGFYYKNTRDTVDTWKINYTDTSGNLNLTLNLLPHNIDGSLNYTYFQVYQDTTAAPIYTTSVANPSTTINLTGLAQGYYYIKVFEFQNVNFEAYSITDSFTQVNIATISLSKATSSATACGSDSVTFSLGASQFPYTVRLYRDGILFDSLVTFSNSAVFTGLNDGNYYATVYGDGATGSAYSKTGSTQFLPPTPSGLSASNVTAHMATLNFSALSCAQHYIVQYKVTGSNTYTTINTTLNTNGMFTLTGLTPATSYTYRIASLDSANLLMSAYSNTATFMTLSALPVSLVTFDGALVNNQALLRGSTSSEFNNKGFEIQKSMNGQTFSDIGFVNGADNSSLLINYSFTDAQIENGSVYYRLKQIDFDDNYTFSKVIKIDFSKEMVVKITPNPAHDFININASAVIKEVRLISLNGQLIKTWTNVTGSKKLDISNAAAGVYILKIMTADDKVQSQKIVKE